MHDFIEKAEKFQPLIVLIIAFIGFFAGFHETVAEYSAGLEDPLLMVLLFFIFLDTDFSDIGKTVKNYHFTIIALIMNFIISPLIAYLLAITVLHNDHELQIALMMLLVMPCTDWYLFFTGTSGGNVQISSAILPINLILQLLLLPLYLSLMNHTGLRIDFFSTAFDVLSVALIPLVLSMFFKWLMNRTEKTKRLFRHIDEAGENIEFIIILLVVFTIFASEGKELLNYPNLYPKMLLCLLIYYPLNFIISYKAGEYEKLSWKDRVSLVFTTTARNSPLSLSLATLIFPDEPLISLALLIGPVTEIPVLVIESWVIKGIRSDSEKNKSSRK